MKAPGEHSKGNYMRQVLLITLCFALFSCNSDPSGSSSGKSGTDEDLTFGSGVVDPEAQNQADFERYISSLSLISLPLLHFTSGDLPNVSQGYDIAGFQKFKHAWTSKPLGILFQDEECVVTVEWSQGEYGVVPFIMTYTPTGDKVDSLAPYEKSGFDEGYEAVEYLTISEDRSVMVVDSVKRWDTDASDSSFQVIVDTTLFSISSEGMIRKQ